MDGGQEATWKFEVEQEGLPGMLLYAKNYMMSGNKISVRTLDLNTDFKHIAVQYIPDTKAMYIYYETGQLELYLSKLKCLGPNRLTEENVNFLLNNFSNQWLMGINVLKRGEYARSLEILSHFQKNILQLIRIVEKNADNWLDMTKNLEKEISSKNYEKFRTTTASLVQSELYDAYKNFLLFVMELRKLIEKRYPLTVSDDLLEKLLHYMNE